MVSEPVSRSSGGERLAWWCASHHGHLTDVKAGQFEEISSGNVRKIVGGYRNGSVIGLNRGLDSGVVVQGHFDLKPVSLKPQVEAHGSCKQRDYRRFGDFWYHFRWLSDEPSYFVISVTGMPKTLASFWIVLGRNFVMPCSARYMVLSFTPAREASSRLDSASASRIRLRFPFIG